MEKELENTMTDQFIKEISKMEKGKDKVDLVNI